MDDCQLFLVHVWPPKPGFRASARGGAALVGNAAQDGSAGSMGLLAPKLSVPRTRPRSQRANSTAKRCMSTLPPLTITPTR